MGSYPALDIKAPQQPDLLEKYGQLQQLRALQQQQQEAPLRMQALQQGVQQGQIGLQQAQQGEQDSQSFRAAMQDPSLQGKPIGDIADVLAHKGQISQAGWVAAKKADLETRSSLAKLDETQLANMGAAHKATQELYNNVMNLPDDQLAANWAQIAQQYDAIPGNNKQPLNPAQPMTKQQLAQFAPTLSMANSYFDQELARREAVTKQKTDEAALGEKQAAADFYKQNGGAPGISQEAIQQADWLKKHPGKGPSDFAVAQAASKAGAEAAARQPYEMSLARQRQALSQGDPNAAGQLLVDGDATLSELKARGATPEFIAKTLFAAKQLSGGKYNAQSSEAQFSVAKSPANVAFFGSAKSLTDKGGTLDQLAAAAKDIPGNQIPVFNSIADAAKAAAGSGPIAKYASLMLGVSDDYSKVMGGGNGSDSSRAQALHLVPANASPEARAAAIEGIRGAVGSQLSSRIGDNPVLKRMYGGDGASAAPAVGATKQFANGKTGKWDGHGWVAQ